MIPKIIHFCWLSKDPYPKQIQHCMDSWEKYLPDYKMMHWNFDIFDINQSLWVKQAFETKNYAFAADYIRLYSLFTNGGIYLDTDVEVIKKFDDLLNQSYFIGEENSPTRKIEAAVIGAEKETEWVKKCLDYYKDRVFVDKDGICDTKPLPDIILSVLQQNYELNYVWHPNKFVNDNRIISVLPIDYFSPKKWNDATVFNVTSNTYTIHHFNASWKSAKDRRLLMLIRFVQRTFGIGIYNIVKWCIKNIVKLAKKLDRVAKFIINPK
jgi:hypothetical protein